MCCALISGTGVLISELAETSEMTMEGDGVWRRENDQELSLRSFEGEERVRVRVGRSRDDALRRVFKDDIRTEL